MLTNTSIRFISGFYFPYFPNICITHAPVVKWGNTPDLGSGAARFVGSSPIRRTFL